MFVFLEKVVKKGGKHNNTVTAILDIFKIEDFLSKKTVFLIEKGRGRADFKNKTVTRWHNRTVTYSGIPESAVEFYAKCSGISQQFCYLD